MDQNRAKSFNLFLENIYTKEQLLTLVDQIKGLSSLIYKTSEGNLLDKIASSVSKDTFLLFEKLSKENLLPQNTNELRGFFDLLAKFLEEVKSIRLTLAFEPKEDFLKKLQEWFQNTLKTKVVLDIITNESVIAGLLIEYNGKYKDYSKSEEVVQSIKALK